MSLLPASLHDLKAEAYAYDLPEEKIAAHPVEPRDASRLLVWDGKAVAHHTFRQLPDLLPAGAVLFFNDTRVIPARLHVQRETGAWIEILLYSHEPDPTAGHPAIRARAMVGNKKKWREGEKLTLAKAGSPYSLVFSWLDREQDAIRVEWSPGHLQFLEVLAEMGEMPIPPYLNREAEERDKADYQTVYARENGAVAAPTAGLHFTDRVLNELDTKGFGKAWLTLHVGLGTFRPMKSDRVAEHDMHPEEVIISRDLVRRLATPSGLRIAVGTTSVRSLESWYWLATEWERTGEFPSFLETHQPYEWQDRDRPVPELASLLHDWMLAQGIDSLRFDTRLYLMPGYRFRVVEGMITNFHQPRSTLMVLVAAFLGEDHWKTVYREALESGYRFLSYGDSSLLLPQRQ